MNVIFKSLSTTELERPLEGIKQSQHNEPVCRELARYCRNGWPNTDNITGMIKKVSSQINIIKGLLMRGNRIIIPTDLQKPTLQQLHTGHFGIQKCHHRARVSVVARSIERIGRYGDQLFYMSFVSVTTYRAIDYITFPRATIEESCNGPV